MAKVRFQVKLEAKLHEAVDKRGTFLFEGGPPDFPSYRESVGYILGLKKALELCEEIEAESD